MTHKPYPSGEPTESPLHYTSAVFIVVITLMLTLLLSACSSTSVDEPTNQSKESNDLIVNISPGDSYTFPTTRADELHAGHKLRYIAWLYKSEDYSRPAISNNLIQRTEQLASEGNQVVFKGVEPGKYFIIIFADYIDATAERNQTGLFDDKYYDTHSELYYVSLKGNLTFNNHNLDCFISTSPSVFDKQGNIEKVLDLTLTRAVSQVQIVANGAGNMEALKDITISQSSVIKSRMYTEQDGFGLDTKKRTLVISPVKSPTDPNLLLFFYTFSATGTVALGDLIMTLNPHDGYEFTNKRKYEIPGSNNTAQIVPQANYIYKVTGNFLSTTKEPATTVNLQVSVNDGWSDS